jgi:hypothetical protein
MESGGFQFGSHAGKGATTTVAQDHRPASNQSIDIERPKTDTFHVKRANGLAQCGTLGKARVACRTLWLCLHLGHQLLQVVLGGFSVIDRGHIV